MIVKLTVLAALAASLAAPQAFAQAGPATSPSASPVQGPTEGNSPGAPAARGATPGGATSAGENAPGPSYDDHLLGDIGGVRTALARYGVSLGLSEQSEVFGNVTGGFHQGATYEGLTQLGLGIDTAAAFGWEGGTFNISALQFHGRGLLDTNVPSFNSVSSAEQTTRGAKLFEAWYEQLLLNKTLSLRVGQLSSDVEFITTEYGGLFINSGYGFPTLPSNDLPSGGPAYPLATPGARLKFVPNDSLAVLAGVFNGNPAGPGEGDPQKRDGGGTSFRLNDGTLVIAEVQYGINQADNAPGLPGTYKFGFWYNTLAFPNERTNYTGLSLTNPASTAGVKATLRNDYSVYATMDQLVWKKPDTKDGGIGVFLRAMGAPPDRNLIDVFIQGGVTDKAPLPGRDNDTVGFAVSWAHASSSVAKLDRTFIAATGQLIPVRGSETQLELTYQAQLAPWLQLQPDFQYIFSPSGGILNPQTGRAVGDAAVLALRTNVTF